MKYVVTISVALFLILSSCSKKKQEPPEKYYTEGLRFRPLTDVKYEPTLERLARGKYLVEGPGKCFECHDERDSKTPGMPPVESTRGEGNVLMDTKDFRLVAPNITPDKETGAGTWTDDMFARAIREGIGHDGRPLYPIMPYADFRNLSDEDLASIIVYIGSLPPVKHVLPKSKFSDQVKHILVNFPIPIYKPVPAPDFTNILERGRYLVHLGTCDGCHTATDGPRLAGVLAGGEFLTEFGDSVYSANLTPDESGITYDANTFIQVIRTGKSGTLHPIMPWVFFRNMTDDDMRAIYAFLRTLKPVRHFVNNISPRKYCAVCGQKHGFGEANTTVAIKTIKADTTEYFQYAGRYESDQCGPVVISRDHGKLIVLFEGFLSGELLPVSKDEFASVNLPFHLKFGRDKKGKVTGLSYDDIDHYVMNKVN